MKATITADHTGAAVMQMHETGLFCVSRSADTGKFLGRWGS
jgi:hypothetical protein